MFGGVSGGWGKQEKGVNMKVLDINANSCWSFHGPNGNTIARLRAAVGIQDPRMREVVLQNIDGKAFGFVGDPTKLDFAPRFFDEVNLNFTPEVHERVALRQCVRRWSKYKADLHEDTSSDAQWGSVWQRVFERLTPSAAG